MLDLELLEKRLDDVLEEGNLCKVSLQEFSIEVLDSESNSIEKIFSENNLIGLSTKINLAA